MAAAIPLIPLLFSAATSIAGGVVANKNANSEANQLDKIGQVEAEDKRREIRRLLASQTVAFAAAGVDVNSGTPLDVLGDSLAEGELAALRARFARHSAANAIKLEGSQAQASGILSGVGTILGGLGGIAGTGAFDNVLSNFQIGRSVNKTSSGMAARGNVFSGGF